MKLMIVDGNSVAWTAGYGTAHLAYGATKTGVIYGFLKFLLSTFDNYDATTLAIVWDSHKTRRKELFPDYKIARQNLDEDERKFKEYVIRQIHQIQNFLAKIGFPNSFSVEGFEGDDLVASLVNQYKHKAEQIFVVSSDSDLYQLLADNISQIKPRKSDELYTINSFRKEFPGIDPSQWAMVKAIAGDTSDSIIGVKGVGINRAIKYLTGQLKPTSKFYERIEQSDDIIHRNLQLIQLPFPGTPNLKLSKPRADLSAYIDFIDSTGMRSLMKKENVDIAKKAFRLF